MKILICNSSGIPDYFQGKVSQNGSSLYKKLKKNEDLSWTFEECVNWSKQIKPKFALGRKNQAEYSDTIFQLLGKILENLTGKSLHLVLEEELFKPLKLKNTFYSISRVQLNHGLSGMEIKFCICQKQ